MTGNGKEGKSNRLTTKMYHDMINNIDTEEDDVAGTCNHCGADGLPEHFCYVCKQGGLEKIRTGILNPLVGAHTVEQRNMYVTSAVFVPRM